MSVYSCVDAGFVKLLLNMSFKDILYTYFYTELIILMDVDLQVGVFYGAGVRLWVRDKMYIMF